MNEVFRKFAQRTSEWTGSAWAFVLAVMIILIWAVTGPMFGFSDTWQLVINTGTTIVTFLMVFLIQNSQNRESKAVHLKLDELILAVRGAKNELIDIESLTEEQLEQITQRYRRFAERYKASLATSLEGVEGEVEELGKKVAEVGGAARRIEEGLGAGR
ncbi:MAG TPA: low affinity iron permease family protein [Chloroflexota bacterium]|nr:low affinity iron permease family protein [Chloroflexota bacterium]